MFVVQTKPASHVTVREMLTKRELGDPSKAVAARAGLPAASLVPRGIIDLTDEGDIGATRGKPQVSMVRSSPQVVPTQTVVNTALAVQPTLASATGIRPTTLLVQQSPGTSAGPQLLLRPVGTQQGLQATAAPAGTTLLYTSRPGTFVVQSSTSPATSIMRPIMATTTATATTSTTLLRPPAPAIATLTPQASKLPMVVSRPPPPLQLAPQQKLASQAATPAQVYI